MICIFFLVLFFNSYFNFTSGTAFNPDGTTIGTRFYLSGPDPYYNMRLCEETLRTGQYPFVTSGDPLMNYPVGHTASARPPLFNMIAVVSAKMLEPFFGTIDALGWSMLFLPAIYGALLVFPVYGIGKELFNRKVGLISALLIAIIPIHIGTGHGSAFSLFDHDSFILLLTTCAIFFIIKMLKTDDLKKSLCYSSLAGLFIAGILLSWAAGYTILFIILIFSVVLLIIDMLKKSIDYKTSLKITILFFVNFLITLPYYVITNDTFSFPFIALCISVFLTVLYFIVQKINYPWIITIPSFGIVGGIGYAFFYLIHNGTIQTSSLALLTITKAIFGSAVYGEQVSLTIGEAHVYGLSQTVMSFGIAIFWIGLVGLCLFMYKMWKEKIHSYQLFFVITVIINFWFTTQAGRFLNDLVPAIVIFSGFIVIIMIDKINYKTMMDNIRSVGFKAVKPIHLLGIIFIAFLVILPNVYCTMDSAVPYEMKEDVFGQNFSGAWGNSLSQQYYWADALYWLSQQDTNISRPEDRPGILTWWDYGFYIVSMGGHPAVADNYQDGIQPAANFLTSQSEDESISILIIRCIEGTKRPIYYGTISESVKQVIYDYFPEYNETKTENNETTNVTHYPANDIIKYMDYPKQCPSYNQPVAKEWGNTELVIDEWNAMYHDVSKIICTLSEEKLMSFYNAISDVTNTSVSYIGVEYRDMTDIFGVFPFLADKSTFGYTTFEDDFYKMYYLDKNGNEYTIDQVNNMTEEQIKDKGISQHTLTKDAYYNSISFRIYNGVKDTRLSTYGLRHFKPVYMSPYVTIAKYYEGANITGTVRINGSGYIGTTAYVLDEYGLVHSGSNVNYDGSFHLLGLEGNTSIIVIKDGNIIGQKQFETPITEDEATRHIESDRNLSIDINLSKANILITNVNEIDLNLSVKGMTYLFEKNITDLENKVYLFGNMIPDTYRFVITNNTGFELYNQTTFLYPDNNDVNISVGANNE